MQSHKHVVLAAQNSDLSLFTGKAFHPCDMEEKVCTIVQTKRDADKHIWRLAMDDPCLTYIKLMIVVPENSTPYGRPVGFALDAEFGLSEVHRSRITHRPEGGVGGWRRELQKSIFSIFHNFGSKSSGNISALRAPLWSY